MDSASRATRAFFEELDKLGAAPAGMKIFYVGPEFGAGHMSQAKSLAAAAQDRGINAELIDFHRTFSKPGSRQKYEQAVASHLGKLEVGSGAKLVKEHVRHYATGIDRQKLQDFVERNKDQAVVATMPHLQQAMQGIGHPVHVLHTDPETWEGETAFSPLQLGKRIHVGTKDAIRGLHGPDEKKIIKGLPVHPDALRQEKKTGLMDRGNLNVTVSGGAQGLEVLPMTQRVLQGLPGNATVHAVAGKNEKVRKQLEQLADKDPRVRPYGFAPLRQLMREADLNVIRAHGTTFQESVAAGKPAVYYAPDPKLVDYQGRLTKGTALYGQKNVGQPAAIGLEKLPDAVDNALSQRDRLLRRAERHQKAMGNPADEAVRFIMKPRPEYTKTAADEKPSKLTKFLRKAGPGLGGAAGLVTGALLGARRGKALQGALAGLGTGATLGWVPDMVHGVREGAKELER